MPRRLSLPDSASVAVPDEEGRLFAPSAARNRDAITAVVARLAPDTGRALEIASGTGQHVAALAERLPGLAWQPSDPDPARRLSIDAYCAGLDNVAEAVSLDATAPGWALDHAGQDVILLVNLLHLISSDEAHTLIRELPAALAPGGVALLYGPFLRSGEATSEGDAAFHAQLTAQDPEIGYKDDIVIRDWLHAAALELEEVVEMPSNNLCFVARLPA